MDGDRDSSCSLFIRFLLGWSFGSATCAAHFLFFAASLVTDFATLTGADQGRYGKEKGGTRERDDLVSSLFALVNTSKCVFGT